MKIEAEESNVMSWLIKAGDNDDNDDGKWDMSWLEGDAVSMVVAGSEPEASTFVFLFYYLAKLSDTQAILCAKLVAASFATEARRLQSLPILNGCIHEAFRLHSPLPSGCLRITPAEGLNIDGRVIPGTAIVLTPIYSLGRLESCFGNAKEFVPERWNERREMLRNKTAWVPFNIGTHPITLRLLPIKNRYADNPVGRYACVGRNPGLMELRIVMLVANFSIRFAPGEDGPGLLEDTRDASASAPEKIELVFQAR